MTNPLTTSNSTSSNNNEVNSLIREVNQMKEVQIFKDDSGTRRVLMGRGGNGFYGFKVSQEGFDVYDATDSQLVFNSDNNIFKIISSGTATVTAPTSGFTGTTTITTTVAHGATGEPASIVFVENPSQLSGVGYISPGLTQVPSTVYITNSGAVILVSTSRVDSTNIYFDLTYLSGGAGDIGPVVGGFVWTFKYYILQETAN